MKKFSYCILYVTAVIFFSVCAHADSVSDLCDDFESYPIGSSAVSDLKIFSGISGPNISLKIETGGKNGNYLNFTNEPAVYPKKIAALCTNSGMLPFDKTRIKTDLLLSDGKNTSIQLSYLNSSYTILNLNKDIITLLSFSGSNNGASTKLSSSSEWYGLDVTIDVTNTIISAALTRYSDGETIECTRDSDLSGIDFKNVFNPNSQLKFIGSNTASPNAIGIDNIEISNADSVQPYFLTEFSCNGEIISETTDGDINIKITKSDNFPEQNVIFAALYSAERKLKSVKIAEADGSINVDKVSSDEEISVFAWTDMITMTPIADCIRLTRDNMR